MGVCVYGLWMWMWLLGGRGGGGLVLVLVLVVLQTRQLGIGTLSIRATTLGPEVLCTLPIATGMLRPLPLFRAADRMLRRWNSRQQQQQQQQQRQWGVPAGLTPAGCTRHHHN